MITRKQWSEFLTELKQFRNKSNYRISFYFENRYIIGVDEYCINTYEKPIGSTPDIKYRKIYDYNWVLENPYIKLGYLYKYLELKMSYSTFKDNFR